MNLFGFFDLLFWFLLFLFLRFFFRFFLSRLFRYITLIIKQVELKIIILFLFFLFGFLFFRFFRLLRFFLLNLLTDLVVVFRLQWNRHRVIACIRIYRQVNRMLLLFTVNSIGHLTLFPLILRIPHRLRNLIIFKLLLILFLNLINPFLRLFGQVLWWFWCNYRRQLILTFECVVVGGGIWLIELLRLRVLLWKRLLGLVLWRIGILWGIGSVRGLMLGLVIVLAVVTAAVVRTLTVEHGLNIFHLHFSE